MSENLIPQNLPTGTPPPTVNPPAPPTSIEAIDSSTMEQKLQEEIKTSLVPEKIENPPSSTPSDSGPKPEQSKFSYIKPLRTYESDVADAIKSKNASLTKIAVAENIRRQKNGESELRPKSPIGKNILIFSLSMFLVALGAILLYNFYISPKFSDNVPSKFEAQSLITPDSRKEIVLAGQVSNFIDILSGAKNGVNKSLGTITEFYFTKPAVGGKTLISAAEFIRLLDTNAPDALLRSLGEPFMFGYHEFNGTHPFLILTNSFYQNAFASMLKWEETMAEDLSFFIRASLRAGDEAVKPQSTADILRSSKAFTDMVIKNKDVRALSDQYDHIVLLYTFFDKDTIIIGTNEFTLKEILDRMTNRRFVR